MTRTGKIARLPRAVREALNCRLLDGETGPRLAAWLNEQPEVRATLAEHFEGREITVQNLSEWRQGGWEDWCRRRDALELAALVGEEAEDFDRLTAGGARLADRYAQATALGLIKQFRAVEAMEEGPAKLRATLRVIASLVRLRGCERQWERSKREGELHAREMAEREFAHVDGINARAATGTERARRTFSSAEALKDRAAGAVPSGRIAPNPSKSDQIRPAVRRGVAVEQVEAEEGVESVARGGAMAQAGAVAHPVAVVRVATARERSAGGSGTGAVETAAGSGAAEVNPTKSDQIQPREFSHPNGIRVVPTAHTEHTEKKDGRRWRDDLGNHEKHETHENRTNGEAPTEDTEKKFGSLARSPESGSSPRPSYPYPVGFNFLPQAHGYFGDHLIRAA